MMKAFAFAVFFLAACSFAPRETGAGFMFALEPVSIETQGQSQGAAPTMSLIVALPTTSPELDTQRIALKKGGRWDYYAAARWSDFLPALVQDRLTKTLEETGRFTSVTADNSGLMADMILKMEIRDFEAVYAPGGGAPTARVRMNASLVTRLGRAPVASFTAAADSKAAGNTLSDIQRAFAAAFVDAQRQLDRKLAQQLVKLGQ